MGKESLYREMLDVVCAVTGVNENDLLSSNREECADARFLLVLALSMRLTDLEICGLLRRTRQGISFIRSNVSKLRKWSVNAYWKEIKSLLQL